MNQVNTLPQHENETGVCKMLRYGLSLEGLSFAINFSYHTY